MKNIALLLFGVSFCTSNFGIGPFTHSLSAQNSILVQLTDGGNGPVAYATVSLLTADSTFLTGGYSEEDGTLRLDHRLPDGTACLVEARHLDYGAMMTALTTGPGASVALTMTTAGQNLDEVIITATRPLIRREIDKLVFDVAGSSLAVGEDGMNVLQYVPGLWVDENGGLRLNGKSGILVMVNERVLRLSGATLASYLQAIPSEQIQSVEVIANPPARYEAEGVAGIVKLVMKRGYNQGWNATVGLSHYSSPRDGDNFQRNRANANLTAGVGRFSLTGLYAFDRSEQWQQSNGFREVAGERQDYGIFVTFLPEQSHNAQLGLDYELPGGGRLFGSWNGSWNSLDANLTNSSLVTSAGGQSGILTESRLGNTSTVNAYNLGFDRSSRDEKQQLTVLADAYLSSSDNADRLTNRYRDGEALTFREDFNQLGEGRIDVLSTQADYRYEVTEALELSVGTKVSAVRMDNQMDFNDLNREVRLDSLSNDYDYRERIGALYGNAAWTISDSWSMQTGLRFEQTRTRPGGGTGQDYGRLFPSVFVSYTASETHEFGLSYGSRIERPGYEAMNPYLVYVDPFLLQRGNPSLQPSYSHNFELSHLWNGNVSTSLTYTITDDVISDVELPTGDGARVVEQTTNLGRLSYWGLSSSATIRPVKWLRSVNSGQLFYSDYRVEDIARAAFSRRALAGQLMSRNTFTLPGGAWKAELSAIYLTPSVDGVYEQESNYLVNVALTRPFLGDRGRLKLKLNDAFNSYRPAGSASFEGFRSAYTARQNTRYLSLSLNFNLDRGKQFETRSGETSNQEELNRLQ